MSPALQPRMYATAPLAFDVSQLIPYEKRLDQNSRWALSEGSVFFEDKGAVQQAMRRIAQRLDELGVPYAIVGGMALFQHGFAGSPRMSVSSLIEKTLRPSMSFGHPLKPANFPNPECL